MAQNNNITYGSYLVDKNGSPINSIASLAQAPVDYRLKVKVKADLTNPDTWLAQEAAGSGIAGVFNSVYYGLITYVAEDGDNNGLYVLKPGSGGSAAEDAKLAANWERISQSDTKITGITDRLTTVEGKASTNETAILSKLDKDFVTSYTQGTIGESTVFAAREDNTPEAENIYITGAQIKTFAASAVSDKGTFATDAALKEAYPNPEDGWTATVLSTGTTWVASDGEWTDSGTASGVTSVNGKTGNVVLVAADIDDVYSDVETNTKIEEALDTTEYDTLNTTNKTVLGSINELKTGINANTSNISTLQSTVGNAESGLVKNVNDLTTQVGNNTSAISTNTSSIESLSDTVDTKQDATISVSIQEVVKTSIPDALTALDESISAINSDLNGAAKLDASNLAEPNIAKWKSKLGYLNSSEVASEITDGITVDTYEGLTTTSKTVQGAINELDTTVTEDVLPQLTSINSRVTKNASDISSLQGSVEENTQDISSLQTGLASKQNTSITIEGITANTVEGALTELNSEIDTLNSGLTTKANTSDVVLKTDISTSIPSASAVNTKVASEKAVADAIANKADKATTLSGYGITDAQSKLTFYSETTSGNSSANLSVDSSTFILNSNGVSGTVVDTSISSSSTNNHIATSKAVYDAVQQVKTDFGSALTYKGSVNTYEELPDSDNSVGDTWNVVQAYQTYPAGTNYAWNGTAWDPLGGSVDLSLYSTTEQMNTAIATAVDTVEENVTQNTSDISDLKTNKANVDASNISTNKSSWKSALGFIESSDIDFSPYQTKSISSTAGSTTVEGALTALDGRTQAINSNDASTLVIGSHQIINVKQITNSQGCSIAYGSSTPAISITISGLDSSSGKNEKVKYEIPGSSDETIQKEIITGTGSKFTIDVSGGNLNVTTELASATVVFSYLQ